MIHYKFFSLCEIFNGGKYIDSPFDHDVCIKVCFICQLILLLHTAASDVMSKGKYIVIFQEIILVNNAVGKMFYQVNQTCY